MPRKPVERFPGFKSCMNMLRNRKYAMVQEDAYVWLLPRVGEFVEPLLAELDAEDDPRMQGWMLELLSAARDVRALPVFVQYLFSPEERVRIWAAMGLRALGQTREGRKMLWGAYQQQDGLLALPDEHDGQRVRDVLADILHIRHPF
jgi:HEAT repeat protein